MAKKKAAAKSKSPQFTVLRDTREQTGWLFEETDRCLGTKEVTLPTGDYTLEGFEERFIIERKGAVSELASNVSEARFERELERLEEFEWPFIICEFTVDDLLRYPWNLKIPIAKKRLIRMKGPNLLRRLSEIQIRWKTRFLFAGPHGQHIALSLFKRVVESV